jgi:hypothetical protein
MRSPARRLADALRDSFGSALAASLLAAVLTAASGCGGVYYAVAVTSASSRVEEARVVGAETLAPYEYYYAREHLEQAQFEAAEASYSDAAHFAETAEEYAAKAVEIAQAARRNAAPQ